MEEKEKYSMSKNEDTQSFDAAMLLSGETLLGSVTNITNPEGSDTKVQQIRSSARVFKKMKLDLTLPTVPEKIEKKEESKQDIKKCFRSLWTSDDKTMFFDALNEYGKDFEHIQTYINSKLRKKSVPDNLIKTKDHVRNFYYRTWHKISKYLKFSEGIKRVTQELYGLINYGELRKKIGSVNGKALLKLNELIYNGFTMIRVKCKNIKVKTPMCKALKKLNQIEDKYDEIKLPNLITVIVKPKNMRTYLKVQCMAQNPRIKTIVSLQTRLSTLFTILNSKWKSSDALFYDKALVSTSPITSDCVPSLKVSETIQNLLNPNLRLTPPKTSNIEIPAINLSEYLTWQTICLSSHEHRLGIATNEYGTYNYSMFKVLNKNSSKKTCSRPRAESISEKSPQKMFPSTDQDNDGSEMLNINENIKEEVKESCSNLNVDLLEVEHEANNKEKQNEIDEQKNAKLERIREGWTESTCESITLGEIYLMIGSDSKIILEYSWDDHPDISIQSEVQIPGSSQDDFSDDVFEYSQKLDVSESLSKLLSVAKLHYRKNIIKCPCGHVCGAKNNARLKKAVESKIRKILTDFDKCAEDAEEKVVPENETNSKFRTPSLFMAQKVRPISPATYLHPSSSHLVSQIDSIRRMKPRYCNRRGRRPRSKQVVVERKLPLLPNRVESDHQIVRMNIITQDNAKVSLNVENIPSNTLPLQNPKVISTDNQIESTMNKDIINDNTSISTSPSRILKDTEDNQWITSEVVDYSLSSLLGHLESPIKSTSLTSESNLTNEDSHMSMGSQLLSLLTESSVDFSANFADLAAQVTNDSRN